MKKQIKAIKEKIKNKLVNFETFTYKEIKKYCEVEYRYSSRNYNIIIYDKDKFNIHVIKAWSEKRSYNRILKYANINEGAIFRELTSLEYKLVGRKDNRIKLYREVK